MSKGKREPKTGLDEERVRRVAENMTELTGHLLELVREEMAELQPKRNRILADVRELLRPLEPEERGLVLSTVAVEMQKKFDEQGSPKVELDGGCVGRDGGGVKVTDGNVSAKACVTGSLSEGPTGGGFEVEVSY